MKSCYLAVAMISAVAGARTESDFTAWKITHGKNYATEEEHSHRFSVFQSNAEFVDAHNQKGMSYTVGLNEFADMTNEEFRSQRLGTRPLSFGTSGSSVHKRVLETAPDSVDWRDNAAAVGPVKNQGSCGSCWTFSAIASIEGAVGIKAGEYSSLSEQNLLDCVKNQTVPYDPNEACCDGCQGGLMDNAFAYVVQKQSGALMTEASYPYKGRGGSCAFDKTKASSIITGYVDCRPGSEKPSAATEEEEANVLDALAIAGPISIAVDAGGLGWQLYFGGVHTCWSPAGNPNSADHGVALVGYGVDGSDKYWIVRNSWGAGWGEKGYMRLEYGKNACGVANFASYPTA
jgi:C1A family cysteine protease